MCGAVVLRDVDARMEVPLEGGGDEPVRLWAGGVVVVVLVSCHLCRRAFTFLYRVVELWLVRVLLLCVLVGSVFFGPFELFGTVCFTTTTTTTKFLGV